MLDYSLQADLVALATRAGTCKIKLIDKDKNNIITETVAIPSPISSFGRLIDLCELGLSGGKKRGYEYESNAKKAQVFLVNSVFLAPRTNRLEHTSAHPVSVILNLDLEELKSVKEAKVEVTFDE
jgi:hypothetical protein